MIAAQTVWFKQGDFNLQAGWLSTKFHLISWTLSIVQIEKYFDKMELITDAIGADLAYDKLKLPCTCIRTDLDKVGKDSYLWVSNKLYTYSIQMEPFIHLDTDAYLFNQLDSRLLTAPLVAQNFEYDHDNYIHAYQDVVNYCRYVPDFIKKDSAGRLTAVNAGIIGGNNVEFFKEFTAFVTNFLQQNEAGLTKCHYDYLNVFVEQFLYKKFAEFKNIPIKYLSPIEFGPPCDYKMSEFTQLPTACDYIHVTNYKRNPLVCEQLAQRLWLESPELYERVLTVCRELDATHHPISAPVIAQQVHVPFYRTEYMLNAIQSSTQPYQPAEDLSTHIHNLPNDQHKHLIDDVFQFECRRRAFIESLPNPAVLKQYWQTYSQQTNSLLALPVDEYIHKQIRQSSYFQRIESEWNWAEANEFALQTADRDLADNLQIDPSYYEVVLYIYLHGGLVREHLLDALNMLILDAVDEPASMASVIQAVCDQVLVYQSEVNQQELADTVMGRVRHFLYQGVLEVVA